MSDVHYRQLPITDLERIARFRTAGYGGSVSDALNSLGVLLSQIRRSDEAEKVLQQSAETLALIEHLPQEVVPSLLIELLPVIEQDGRRALNGRKWRAELMGDS